MVRVWALGLVAVALLGCPALLLGNPVLGPSDVVDVVAGAKSDPLTRAVVVDLRLPRFVLGIVAGAILGLVGVLLQDALRNPIAGPELLGVAPAAAVVLAIVTVFAIPIPYAAVPVVGFAGGMTGGLLVLLLTARAPTPGRVALVGAAVAALMNALIFAVIALGAQYQASLLFVYLLGSLANRSWREVALAVPSLVVGAIGAWLSARILAVLALGDDVAEGLGLRVVLGRIAVLTIAVALVGTVVAVAGPLPWIALVAPHLARQALGTRATSLTLATAPVIGGVLLALADQVARLAFFPLETPVGAWTVLLAGPVAILLLRRLRWTDA